MIKLDIGSGDYPYTEGGGWTSVDLYKPADVKADMGSLPWRDCEVDEIYSSHALEHAADEFKAMAALKEWHRVLKVGGKLTLIVPDLDYCVNRWLKAPDHQSIQMLFGMGRDEGDVHHTGWNRQTLMRDLHAAGFEIKGISGHKSHSQEGLLAVCVKPETPPAENQLQQLTYKNATARVLVACPTYRGKAYSLEAYITAYNSFTYPHRALFMVDNTGTGLEYYEHLRKVGVDADHIDPTSDFHETFSMCWKRIARKAKEGGFHWVMSIEADNICPPLTIDTMLNVASYCRALHVCHSYPWHGSQSNQGVLVGLGCNLINAEMLWDIFSQETWFTNAVESEIYEYPKLKGYPTVELHRLLDIRHLDDKTASEFYHFQREDPPKMGPMVAMENKPIQYQKFEPTQETA